MNHLKKISAALVAFVLIFSAASPVFAFTYATHAAWQACIDYQAPDENQCGTDPGGAATTPASSPTYGQVYTDHTGWQQCIDFGGDAISCGEDPTPASVVPPAAATPASAAPATPAAATPAAATPAAASASNPIPTSTTNDGPIGPVNQTPQKFKADNYSGLVKCSGVKSASTDVECNFTYAISSIATLINWAFYVSIPVAVALFSWAGILYMSGVESKIKQAKTIFQNVAIGFIIALVAFTVVHTLVGWLVNPNIGAESLLQK